MSNLDINEEIDKLVDKLSDQLKSRLKTMVERSQKQVITQYIASQKETKSTSKVLKNKSENIKKTGSKKFNRENDYSSSDSDN